MTISTLWLAGVFVSAAALAQTAPAAPSKDAPTYRESITGTLVTFEMVLVPGGAVTLDGKTMNVEPFYIGRTEVTWDVYDVFAFMLDKATSGGGPDATTRPSHPYGAPDHGWGHAGYPVISVTRQAAEAFCTWLSAKTGKTYRLATEAEWARAATLAAGGEKLARAQLDSLAWHRDNAGAKTHAIGSKKPDALGLHDLFGNAAEWVTADNGRLVTRGGSFRDAADVVGPGARAEQSDGWNERDPQLPKSRWWLSDGPFVGFRIVSKP